MIAVARRQKKEKSKDTDVEMSEAFADIDLKSSKDDENGETVVNELNLGENAVVNEVEDKIEEKSNLKVKSEPVKRMKEVVEKDKEKEDLQSDHESDDEVVDAALDVFSLMQSMSEIDLYDFIIYAFKKLNLKHQKEVNLELMNIMQKETKEMYLVCLSKFGDVGDNGQNAAQVQSRLDGM